MVTVLRPGMPDIIKPIQTRHVKTLGVVEFYMEFYL